MVSLSGLGIKVMTPNDIHSENELGSVLSQLIFSLTSFGAEHFVVPRNFFPNPAAKAAEHDRI